MAKFLRDEFLRNLTIDEDILDIVDAHLRGRQNSTNAQLGASGSGQDQVLVLKYIIRFDGRGYKLTDYKEFKKYYKQAQNIERVIFVLDSALSEKTNRMYGTHYELRFDRNESTHCYIQVASDDGDAVDSVFSSLREIIDKGKNRNGLVRNAWSQLVVQVFGVACGFVFSLIAGINLSPYLKVDNPFVISFLFAFLIFSNTWGYLNQQILNFLNCSFPSVRFKRKGKDTLHWVLQALVGGLLVALALLIINQVFHWVGQILGQYIEN